MQGRCQSSEHTKVRRINNGIIMHVLSAVQSSDDASLCCMNQGRHVPRGTYGGIHETFWFDGSKFLAG